jgi:chromate transporter
MESTASALPGGRDDVTLWRLFCTFAVISATAFGGAGIPTMRRECITRRRWLTDDAFIELYGMAQVCPGPIPVSLAVLIGRRLAGTAGFWVCLVGETVPGFIVLMVLAVLSMNPHMAILRSAIKGCAAAAVGLMLGNSLELSWPYRKQIVDIALLVAVGVAVLAFHVSLALMFLIFIPLSIAAQRMIKRA